MKTSRSHSHHRRHHSSATFSRKLPEAHYFGPQPAYDDLHSGLNRFGAQVVSSRVEDYYEIFNSSRASRATSIPVLDLPDAKERHRSGRVRNSEVDYSKIFGGLSNANLAATYEEIFAGPKGDESSSEEAWTPAETGSLSDDTDSLNSYEAPHQPFDANKLLNMSYHKTSHRGKDGMNGTTHIAQLNAVSGYTFVIDSETKQQRVKEKETTAPEICDATVNISASGEVFNANHHKRAVSVFPDHRSGKPTSEVDFHRGSFGINTVPDPCETDLKKHPTNGPPVSNMPPNVDENQEGSYRSMPQNKEGSKNACLSPPFSDEVVDANSAAAASANMPPSLDDNKEGFYRPMPRNTEGSKNVCLSPPFSNEEVDSNSCAAASANMPLSLDDNKEGFYRPMPRNMEGSKNVCLSPPFSDEEVDSNSAAAASAIALRKAIAEAQARIRIAKDSLDRKNRGFDSSFMSSFKESLKMKEKRKGEINAKPQALNEKPSENCERVDSGEQVFDRMERLNARKVGTKVPDFRDANDFFHDMEVPEGEDYKDCKSILEDHRSNRGSMQEAMKQCNELDMTGREKRQKEKKMMHVIDECEWEEEKMTEKPSQQPLSEKMNASEAKEGVEQKKNSEAPVRSIGVGCGVNDQTKNKKEICVSFKHKEPEEILRTSEAEKKTEEKLENFPEPVCMQEPGGRRWVENENEMKPRVFSEHEKHEDAKTSHSGKELGERFYNCPEPAHLNESDVEENENKQSLKVACENLENAKLLGAFDEQEKNQHGLEEVTIFEELEQNLPDILEYDEIEKPLPTSCDFRQGFEVEQIEGTGWKENMEEINDKEEDNERGSQVVFRHKVDQKKLSAACDSEEIDRRLEEDWEWERNKKFEKHQSHEENEKALETPCPVEKVGERLQKIPPGWEQPTYEMCAEAFQSDINTDHEETDDMLNVDQATLKSEESITANDEDCDWTEIENLSCAEESFTDSEQVTELDAACETAAHGENKRIVEGTIGCCELEHGEVLEVALMGDFLDEKEEFEGDGLAQDDLNYDEAMKEGRSEPLIFDRTVEKETVLNFEKKQADCDLEEHVETLAHELGDIDKEAKISFDYQNDDDFRTVDGDRAGSEKDIGTTQLPCMLENEKETMEDDREIERSEKSTEMAAEEVTEANKNLQQLLDLDEIDIEKVNEEKVKEREREKGRIAVERAIREARERAFAEAQERAAVGRATAEAQQRVKEKARERFKKASMEAKPVDEKGISEARLKSQRAAVERATAEARERALQKAMSEKFACEGRENADKFSTKKFSSSVSMNAANHGAAHVITERFDGAIRESAQRCQAKLERHQRTAERAAKALAEKNMRDLRAQKEQAERNRLAETLDAEVKRWSNGKHGNLRALLSTLQYILGSDSGWQAIPLNDILTAASLKKAYRKAALCVHPDKLQQRGASIQQKYICEKVFDLLKDGWNKFNSEER